MDVLQACTKLLLQKQLMDEPQKASVSKFQTALKEEIAANDAPLVDYMHELLAQRDKRSGPDDRQSGKTRFCEGLQLWSLVVQLLGDYARDDKRIVSTLMRMIEEVLYLDNADNRVSVVAGN
jgi:hypothetical protein